MNEERQSLGGMDTKLCFAEYGDNVIRPYRLFIPSSYEYAPSKAGGEVTPFPLIVMLHGGGSPDHPCDENWFFANKETPDRVQTIAEERGYIIACPALPFVNVAPDLDNRARNWRQYIEEADVDFIQALIKDVTCNLHVDENRIYLSGASRGGLATYASVGANPDMFAAVTAICSWPYEDMLDDIVKVPTLILHAVEDQFFPIDEIRDIEKDLAQRGCDVKLVELPGVHDGMRNMEAYTLIFDWFDAHQRNEE
ncbi:dienelactone hydrolase family protein [Candidatus Hydrogenedentota bacterium]